MRILGLLFIVLSFVGCAKKPVSNANFSLVLSGLADLSIEAQGGMMIWGESANGVHAFSSNINPSTSEFSIAVDNSTDWQFTAIMWDGDTDLNPASFVGPAAAYQGYTRCAHTTVTSTSLKNGDVNVSMSLSNSNCNNAVVFGPGVALESGAYTFPSLEVESCRTNALASVTTDTDICDDSNKGLAGSIGVTLAVGAVSAGGIVNVNPATKVCFNQPGIATVGLFQKSSDARFPSNLQNFPRTYRHYFGDVACNDADVKGSLVYVANSPTSGLFEHYDYVAAVQKQKAYVSVDESKVCSGGRESLVSATAVGMNTASWYWHGICSIDQWDYVQANYPAYSTKNLILLNDLNYYAGFDPLTQSEPIARAFFPMGEALPTVVTAFNGVFEGNNKKIIGAEYEYSGAANNLGLFRRVGPTGKVKNLKVFMSWFEFEEQNSGNGGVGAIAGYNEGLIENVHVIQTELEGYADVGGIAGYNIGTITNASFKDGRISGQKAVGGLVGKSTGVLNTSYVKGTTISNEYQGICSDPSYNDQSSCVSNSQTWNGAMYFGGAIGQIIGCAAVTEASQVSVEAVVIGADRVGGFAGQIDSGITNCAYEDLRIDTFLMATSQNNSYAGGVFGEVISATAATVFGIAATGDIQAVYKYSDAGFVTATAANYVQINSGVLAFKNIAANTSLNTATHTNSNLAASFNIAYDLTNYAGINPVWQNTNQNFELPKLAIQPAEFCDGKHGLTFAGGNGSAASPYLICNIQQLLNLNQFLTAGANFKLLKNINLASVTNLRRNVFCNGEYLVGDLCSVGGAFSGSFDGNMKWLYGFVGTDSSPSFFNEISASGTVKNTFFFSNLSLPSIGIHFGMVAKKNSGVIENVHVFGSMQMNGTFGALRAGSVAAENFGRILGSSSHVVLEINRPGTVVGGFVGSNYGLIAYSRNYSTVYAADAAIAGGLVGTTGNNATSPFSYTDPITNNTYNVNKSVIYRIENDAHVKLMNSAGTTFSVAQKLGGVVGEALSGLFNDIDNRGSIVFKSAEYAGPHDYSIGPMTCTAPSNNVYRVSAAGTGNGYTWAAGDLAFCFEGQVFQCSNTADIFPETVTTTHYIPACLFGSFTARTGSSSVEISNNASNSDFNNIAAVYGLDLHGVNQSSTFYRSGYFVGSVSAGTIDNNLFANFPRFRVSNEIEKIYNGDGNSFNLYLHWITSGYHQAYPFAHTDTNTDNTVLTPVDLTTDIFTSDYILSAGQATRTVSTTAAGSLTLDAPTGYNLTDESLYFVDSAQISALSTVMGSYGFDVSEESADLDTTWYTRDTSDSYWVNTEDYEDIVYKDMYIDLYNQAINQ